MPHEAFALLSGFLKLPTCIQTLPGNRASSHLLVAYDPAVRERSDMYLGEDIQFPLLYLGFIRCVRISHQLPRSTFFAQPPPPAVTQAFRGRRLEMHRPFDISLSQLV
jgi:hypothetical protein